MAAFFPDFLADRPSLFSSLTVPPCWLFQALAVAPSQPPQHSYGFSCPPLVPVPQDTGHLLKANSWTASRPSVSLLGRPQEGQQNDLSKHR